MHRSRVRRATQGDQKAQGQNRTHRFFSNRPRCACLGKAQAAPSQQIAASRLVTSVASRDLRCVTASLTPRDAVPDRRIAAVPPSSVMSFRRFMCQKRKCPGLARHVRFTLRTRHGQPAPTCPFGANATELACSYNVRFPLESDRLADIPVRQLRGKLRNTQHEQMSSALPPRTDVGLAFAKTLRGSNVMKS